MPTHGEADRGASKKALKQYQKGRRRRRKEIYHIPQRDPTEKYGEVIGICQLAGHWVP